MYMLFIRGSVSVLYKYILRIKEPSYEYNEKSIECFIAYSKKPKALAANLFY